MRQVDSVQPMVTIEDCVEAEEIFKADAEVQRLIRERYGITDMAEVACDPWYYGGRFGAAALSLPFHLVNHTLVLSGWRQRVAVLCTVGSPACVKPRGQCDSPRNVPQAPSKPSHTLTTDMAVHPARVIGLSLQGTHRMGMHGWPRCTGGRCAPAPPPQAPC